MGGSELQAVDESSGMTCCRVGDANLVVSSTKTSQVVESRGGGEEESVLSTVFSR